MDPRSSEPDWDSMDEDEDDGVALRMFGRRRSLVDEGMKGVADPLLSQEPASVLPSYASLMDTDVGQDFSEDKLMKSGNLYSLYLLNPDSTEDQHTKNGLTSSVMPNQGLKIKKETMTDDEEEIDVENESGKKEASPRIKRKASQPQENGDALFEGMPFYELVGKEVGPCKHCNMWRTIRFMSYCGRYPFCCVNCTKKFTVYKREQGELLEKTHEECKPAKKLKVPTLFEKHKFRPLFPPTLKLLDSSKVSSCNGIHGNVKAEKSPRFDWPSYLEEHVGEAAPVKCFHHAALSKEWKANLIGALVEVQNRDPDHPKDSFWVARVIRVAGYKTKLRFEGYGMDNSNDFWVHLCKTECYPINGAVKAGMKLKPPKGVIERLGDKWLEHLARISKSDSPTFSFPKDKLKECFEIPFKKDMKLEVVYKRQVSSTCVATVKTVIGDRLHVQYDNCKDPSKDFWFHRMSPLIHPVGWSQRVGHPLVATEAYKSEALDKGRQKRTGNHDAPWDIFNMPQSVKQDQSFHVGMKLEVIDPLKLSQICIGTVMHVLEEGYLMIGVDGCLTDQSSWFCYHSSSSSLLPVGFCEYHHIDLVPPKDFQGSFDWDDYLRNTASVATPVELFHQKTVDPGFKVGQKVEAVDLIESGLICAASIVKIAGPLLRIHFDGWDSSYDQWMDCQSPDIYPVGWCEMVGYPLQPPRMNWDCPVAPVAVFKNNGKKIKISRGLRPDNKKRRSLSVSFDSLANTKSTDNYMDSVYSFSDDEGMSGYQELLKTIAKPLKNSKKEKKDKKDRKSSKPKHHKTHSKIQDKPNGKGRPESGPEVSIHTDVHSGSELKHLLTTIQVTPPDLTPRPTPKSTPKSSPKSSPKSGIATPLSKKPKKLKTSKKASAGGFTLSTTEASILDDIFCSISKDSNHSSSTNSTSSNNAAPFVSSHLSSLQLDSLNLSSKASLTKLFPALNSSSSVVNSSTPAMNAALPPVRSQKQTINYSQYQTKISASQGRPTLALKPELPTLNNMQDAPLQQTSDSSLVDRISEMPPLIPVGELRADPILDANKFQDAFLLQLSQSLKASKAKSDKKSRSKPKKSRSKDKDKESSRKSSKKEEKRVKCKKEGKSKEQKKSPRPSKPKTSHLAQLLMKPGALDFSNIDPQKVVNGFYVAGASSGVPQEISKTESTLHNIMQSPKSASQTSASSNDRSKPLLASLQSVDTMFVHRTTTNSMDHKLLHSPSRNHRLPSANKVDHMVNGLMSPGLGPDSLMPTFDTMEYDILQNCIDPNLLHKPSGRDQRSVSMDNGMLQRDTNEAQKSALNEYQFLPNSYATEEKFKDASSETVQKATVNRSKAKPKPKPRPKKKKNNSNIKMAVAPRPRSNSLPLQSVPVEAQHIMTNGMDLEMMQGMLSPMDRGNNRQVLELEHTQQHILSSILHDHAHQVVPPEQLRARQRAAMQEKFCEFQQLQMRMQMSQSSQSEKACMPPLVELRRPPMHMGFPGPPAMLTQRYLGNQVPGLRMPMSSAATMMSQMDPRLTSPRIGQQNLHSMVSLTPQASMPPHSPQSVMSPNSPSGGMQSMVPCSPKSFMVPSPQGMIPPPSPKSTIPRSPKSVAMPSPKSVLPNSPTSMPPPSPQSGSNSIMCSSPQSMLPPSPQAAAGQHIQTRIQQTSPTPGPTSPMMMIMQARSHAAGLSQNQHMMTTQSIMPSNTVAPQTMQKLMTGNAHGIVQQGAQPKMSPLGMMSPPIGFPATSPSQMPFGLMHPGQERSSFTYGSPLQSPQSSPTGAPTQRLPPLYSLLRPSGQHIMSHTTLPSPVSNPSSSPVQSPHPSPSSFHSVFSRVPQTPQQIPTGYHQISPGQPQIPLGKHQMLPGHLQTNVPIQQMTRPAGFPVRMGFPTPPPSYGSPTSASIPRMQSNPLRTSSVITKLDCSTDGQASKQQSHTKPVVGIMNPWEWSISDVIQFIADAGEGACAEPFRRQKIDGPKFMSLSKDQLAKLTGMKVAPSLKIYQQIVRLRSMFPTQEHAKMLQQ